MNNARYWIWLQLSIGAGKSFKEMIEHFGSVEEIYNSTFPERCRCSSITDKIIEKMDETTLDDADKIIAICAENEWDIITYDDSRYPAKLREIYQAPAVLYVDGKMPDFDNICSIGIVGTRKASRYALKVSRLYACGFADGGAIVVSGGALGVDSSAHYGALDANGVTVAVLGCGLGAKYLVQNAELREMIKRSGALITEYPPYTSASRHTFPMRNRIISGLSDGVLVTEAGSRSGSLITASCAVSQNRDVFAIPASVLDDGFTGTNRLIDDGAIVATSPKKVLEEYREKYRSLAVSRVRSIKELCDFLSDDGSANAPQEAQIDFADLDSDRQERLSLQDKAFALSGEEKLVYDSMRENYEDIDTISDRCGLAVNNTLIALTMLELEGLVQPASGKRYKRK